jgi:N-methylhydantoinase A/oxoprolinase/acetone carboxylase beta subunit
MAEEDSGQTQLRLGIDTGGTYTDAALVDAANQVVASGKSLTTHRQLEVGISAVLKKLPFDLLSKVTLASLSTTLATNAVVEGRGTPVCLLLPGYTASQIERAKLEHIVRGGACVALKGGHDAGGREKWPLDLESASRTIEKYRNRVSAFGVSSMFSVRNPAHEITLRELIHSLSDRPVTCGHELASSLGAPRRAVTVAFNASLVSYIDRLIRTMQALLSDYGVSAPLMVVKGDGSLITAAVALTRPVETVLSGPAASVVGAAFLAQTENSIVADMGGTTTDVAIVTDGLPVFSADATVIGEWRPMIESTRVFSVGLGGDSEARFSGGEGLGIGPRRVVPMSLLAFDNDWVIESLKRQRDAKPTPRSNRFFLPLFADSSQIAQLSLVEKQVWARLAERPLELETLYHNAREQAQAAAVMVRKGMVIYSGFTPSDAAHVLGFSNHWSTEAAHLAAVIWAKQMRQVYGWGSFDPNDSSAVSQVVHDKVVSTICETVIKACMATGGPRSETAVFNKINRLLTEWITDNGTIDGGLFTVKFDPGRSLVAVGAPAPCYYPVASRMLGIDLKIPKHSDVANAIGAVVGSVVQREHITITQPSQGIFRVHSLEGPVDFPDRSSAFVWAETIASELAKNKAVRAGATAIGTVVNRYENTVSPDDLSNDVFFGGHVTATSTGRPVAPPANQEPPWPES